MKNLILFISLFLITAIALETRGETNPVRVIKCKEECYVIPKEIVNTLEKMKDRKIPTINIIEERI